MPAPTRSYFLTWNTLSALLLWQLFFLLTHQLIAALPLQLAFVDWYTRRFGDPQADYAAFSSFVAPFAWTLLLLESTSVTFFTLWLFKLRRRRDISVKNVALCIIVWQLLTFVSVFTAYHVQLSWHINQLGWRIFGPPENVWGIYNLVFPRLLAWLICTIPAGLVGLWLYDKLGNESRVFVYDKLSSATTKSHRLQFSLKTPLVVVGACALLLTFWVAYYHHRLVNLEGLPEDTTELERGRMHVTDSALIQLRRLPDLERLGLAKSRVTDSGLVHLRGLRKLKWLDLSNTDVTDAGLLQLQTLAGLEGLHLSGTQISDEGLVYLEGLTNLDTLYLGYTQVTDKGLEDLKTLTNLENLSLAGTKVTDDGVRHLEALTKLRWLALDGTQVTDQRVNELRQVLTNLYSVRR